MNKMIGITSNIFETHFHLFLPKNCGYLILLNAVDSFTYGRTHIKHRYLNVY